MILKSDPFHFVSLLYDQIQEISIKKYFIILGLLIIIWFREVFFNDFKRSIYAICISFIFVLSNELIKELKRFNYAENVTGVYRVLLCLGTLHRDG